MLNSQGFSQDNNTQLTMPFTRPVGKRGTEERKRVGRGGGWGVRKRGSEVGAV